MQGECQEYKVIVTWEAIYDIAAIADYVEVEFGKERADRFQIQMKEKIVSLAYMGDFFGKTYIYYRSCNIYRRLFPPSIIFYIVKEAEKEIHVLRVLRQECDWKNLLSQRETYTYLD